VGTVEVILQLQRKFSDAAREFNALGKQWSTLNAQYCGGRDGSRPTM
jgi:hypothetical protein